MAQSLSQEDVLNVAKLARVALCEAEVVSFQNSLSKILSFVEILNEADTSSVEPMTYAMEIENVFREDVVTQSLSVEAALANAPETDGRYFEVPAILDGESS